MNAAQPNQDLIWKIGSLQFRETTVGFLKRFEASLCLFSNTVAQLYSNYEIVPEHSRSDRMVALPDPFADHDTFNHVKSDAVVATGIRIIPTEFTGKPCSKGSLTMLYRSKKTNKMLSLPLAEGLKRLEKKYGAGEFLPVMINKDLHLINGSVPAMHLHRVKLDKLHNLSSFQRNDIQYTIGQKIAQLAA